MITTAKVVYYKDNVLVVEPSDPIDRELLQKEVETIEIRLNDGRTISADQRKKVFAIIKDIALWSGNEPEYIRKILTWEFCSECDEVEYFSLSTVDMTIAKEYINYLIKFCFEWNVPTKKPLITQSDDMGRYLYYCLEHRKCAICNKPADAHHVDRIGMGFNRDEIVHEGKAAIALCRECHTKAHQEGEDKLFKQYHIFGIKLDKYLCTVLGLKGG